MSSDSGEEYLPEGGEEEVEVAEAEEEKECLAEEEEEVEEDVENELGTGTGRIRRSTTKKYKGETVSIQKQ